MTEEELAAVVIAWLEDMRWDVYQEVQVYSGVADIVAVNGAVVWIVECKKTLSLALLYQAWNWNGYGNYVSVAVPRGDPYRRQPKGRHAAKMFLREHGIGLLTVGKNTWSEIENPFFVGEEIKPKLSRSQLVQRVRDVLHPEQKTYAKAGNPNGKRFTAFQATVMNLKDAVQKEPGITLGALIEKVSHHYATPASAKSCIPGYIYSGVITGLRLERDGRQLKVYPEEARDADTP